MQFLGEIKVFGEEFIGVCINEFLVRNRNFTLNKKSRSVDRTGFYINR